jgi:polyglutamine-binding protein 1
LRYCRWNVHHICTVFCLERWGEGAEKPSKAYKERFNRLLDRYPLPKKGNWVYIYDPGCQSFYFWNKEDNLVSWLPPKHPKAVIGKSAATLRNEKDRPDMDTPDPEPEQQMMTAPLNHSPPPQNEERYQRPLVTKKTKSRDLEKILRTKKGRRQFYENSDVIDPMDPASYGECGKGRWSSGLQAEERGAADSTAGGTLFQQRPYPSPGDVLRAQGKRKESSDNSDHEGERDNEKKQRRYSEEMEQ